MHARGGAHARAAPAAHERPLAAAPAVEVDGVVRRLGKRRALDGVSLTVPQGVTFGFLGPNGSGKTTLLRLIAGGIRPTNGEVRVFGVRPQSAAGAIGYLPQTQGMHPLLSVYENVRLFAQLQGVRDRDEIVGAIAAVGLTDEMHRPAEQLSGGMQRRASFACSIVHRPKLLLLDEPTVGVDPEVRKVFWEHFAQLNAEGVTIVLSTHAMDEAERCQQLAVLREGHVLAAGAPAGLRSEAGAATLEDAYLRLTKGGAR
jgi:ABC-2 type transport system ATP-binding protein